MSTLVERQRRGAALIKSYKAIHGSDQYACAIEAIADVLLSVAENYDEALRILRSAEIDFRNESESESFFNEG